MNGLSINQHETMNHVYMYMYMYIYTHQGLPCPKIQWYRTNSGKILRMIAGLFVLRLIPTGPFKA